ncbi:MAG: hypothetical protein SVU94_12840 [Bacteroidota bacterium]|nr:hypothetical protein [Bacteroidota bacterium]
MDDFKKHSLYKPMETEAIFSHVFTIYKKKFIPLFLSGFIAFFFIQFIIYNLGISQIYTIADPEEMMRELSGFMSVLGIVISGTVIIYGLLNAFFINLILKNDGEKKLTSGELFVESLKKHSIHMIFFLLLSGLIVTLGTVAGIFIFIIGFLIAFVYLGTVLFPGAAIVVAEEKNALEAISRTFSLVHKDFWSTLGAMVLFVIMMILISIVVSALMSIPFVIIFFDNWSETGNIMESFKMQNYDVGMWIVLLNALVSALTYPFYAIFSVVLYFKLRYKEDQESVVIQ